MSVALPITLVALAAGLALGVWFLRRSRRGGPAERPRARVASEASRRDRGVDDAMREHGGADDAMRKHGGADDAKRKHGWCGTPRLQWALQERQSQLAGRASGPTAPGTGQTKN
ncbi:hypothetical protein GE300_10125 [Rhodobacteraceae bacterium 2CG4]|uniref:Uncharacterized protein n=1 Tax=Halovulum marinum TaxID=2662447 RepID=A0A6L5Z1M4_9RHOB|nr:hypothetical protein [Halovulum marinum]MSU89965.1 hypothetical protein [Halovulum marinum]